MNNDSYIQLYKSEKYDLCLDAIKQNSSNNLQEYVLFGEKLIDETVQQCFYKNNYLVCSAFILNSESLKQDSWSDILNQFIQMHVEFKGLIIIPITLKLNYVYNALWWYWTKPKFNCEDVYFNRLMEILSQTLVEVLNKYKETYFTNKHVSIEDVLNLVKLSSKYLIKMNCLESIQLLDIYVVIFQIIVKKRDCDLISSSINFFESFTKTFEVLQLHLMNDTIGRRSSSALFKFGLDYSNSMACASSVEVSMVALLITGSLANLYKENYESALNYLIRADKLKSSDGLFKFILNYLRAYCHLYLEQDNDTELMLASMTSDAMGEQRKSYYYQLLGSLFSHRGQHTEAISHFEKAVETGFNTSAALLLAANVAEELNISSTRCIFLKNLVDTLKAARTVKDKTIFELRSFQEHCLSALHPNPIVTLSEALYLLAKEALISQHHHSSTEYFSELLASLKKEGLPPSDDRPAPLPTVPIIYHEAALANFKAHNLTEALSICEDAISKHMPRSTFWDESIGSKRKREPENSNTEQDLESVLALMEEDVVALILASDILFAQKEYRKAGENLDKCFNTILDHKNFSMPQKKAHLGGDDQSSNIELFCDCLLAKILLRKAKVNETNNYVDSVHHYYRRALQFAPGDQDVIASYRQWLKQHPDQERFNVEIRKDTVSVEEVQSCALKYILECNAQSEEEPPVIAEEYDLEEDLVDSLFDDY